MWRSLIPRLVLELKKFRKAPVNHATGVSATESPLSVKRFIKKMHANKRIAPDNKKIDKYGDDVLPSIERSEGR